MDKVETEFPINRSKASGRGSMCKPCKKVYNAAYYVQTKHIHNPSRTRRTAEVVRENRLRVLDYLQSHPCVVCGEVDPVVLEFDHQRDKRANLSEMMCCGWTTILAEIAKCDVVCANCHRRRTAQQQNWLKARFCF